jgi:hypothetical protein
MLRTTNTETNSALSAASFTYSKICCISSILIICNLEGQVEGIPQSVCVCVCVCVCVGTMRE